MELQSLDVFLFVARLLSVKSQQITNFLTFIYLAAIAKLKPKIFTIEPISKGRFEELTSLNNYEFDFFGDIYSCALLSINTLAALSASNKSWLKILNLNPSSVEKDESNRGFIWKIEVPSVETNNKSENKNYSIQCICNSNVPKDFVLYVTDVKLFNIVRNLQSNDSLFCDAVHQVTVECDKQYDFPCIAKSAVVSGVGSETDIISKDFGDVLDDYFSIPKLVRVGEIIHVDLLRNGEKFKSRTTLWNVSDIYFQVTNLKGQSKDPEQYILKGYTDLYLNPPVLSYLPTKQFFYIKTQKNIQGFDLPICPDGLVKYFNKLKQIFKFLTKGGKIEGMILLTGAKGSGKKTTLRAVSKFFGLHFLQVKCFDLFGLNPSTIQGKLDQVSAKLKTCLPCVIYLENVELLGREQNYNENMRLIDLFQTYIQQLLSRKPNGHPVLVVGSTPLPVTELVPAIARLFIHVVSFDAPKQDDTYFTLKWLLKKSNLICSPEDLKKVTEKVRGYIFADLVLLMEHSINIKYQDGSLVDRIVTLDHFKKGIDIMEAAYSDAIGAARVPTVHWEDVGGLADLKEEIMLTLNLPTQHPELFSSGLKRSGILFYGPPGTGKTLMAKAVATECNYNFLSVKGPELMNMYVGQSEKNVREVFERAREAAPCIIFFDELDSLAPSRGKSADSGGVTDRVVSQLLAEMDGFDKNKDVFVIAATNRPDLIDQALLRPGRFDKMFYVGVCKDKDSKRSVLKALTRRFILESSVDFDEVIKRLPAQVTGADLYSVCSNAWFSAARKIIEMHIEKDIKPSLPVKVSSEDFVDAISKFVPSLTSQDIDYYENISSSGPVKEK